MGNRRRLLRRLFRLGMMATLFAGATLGVVGCGGSTSDAPRGGTLTGVRWVLASYAVDGADAAVPASVTSDATFTEDKVGGSAGVNQYSASYDSDTDGSIKIGEIASTMMAGPPEATAVENAVFSALKAAATYYADGKTLTLYDKDDKVLLVYDKQEKTSLVGTQWLVTNYNNGTEAIVSTVGDVDLTALFDETGKVSGFAGVNTYNGDYTLEGASVKIGPLATTKMAGPPELMEQEQLYLVALQSSAKYIIAGDKLEFHDADGAIAVKLIRK